MSPPPLCRNMENTDREVKFDSETGDGPSRGVIDMQDYRERYGPATKQTPAADGSGGTKTPDPRPEVEPDVPDGYVPEERLDELRRELRQEAPSVGPTASASSSGGSPFDRLIDRAASWLR